MPTIVFAEGYKFQIFVQDHLPAHVHVFARGCEAIFYLMCANGVVVLRNNDGFKPSEIRTIRHLVQQHQTTLCLAWEEIHGDLG